MRKIKKGDEVIVLVGKSKGVHGKALRVIEKGTKIIVEGANMVKKHVKANPNTNTKGSISEREAPLHISNVAIYNPISRRADKVAFKTLESGKVVRCFKSSGEMIEI